ncbi:GNAT family N-acetyltransferase [Rufibacter soli]
MSSSTTSTSRVSIQPITDPAPIQAIALATWTPTYEAILAQEQIDYMLEQLYTPEALRRQMQEGQTFLLLTAGHEPAAFAAFSCLKEKEHLFKLNKLYIHPRFQGRGYGKLLLEEVTQLVKQKGGKKLELNVHRENPAKDFYLKQGFKILQKIDIPFGPFTLNDYIMCLIVTSPEKKAG